MSGPEPLIVGASHALRLVLGAYRRGLPFRGGFVAPGSFFCRPFFTIRDGGLAFTPQGGGRPRRLADAGDLLGRDGPILTDIGLNIGVIGRQMANWAAAAPAGRAGLSTAAFRRSVLDGRVAALDFYAALGRAGRAVYAVAGPLHPRTPEPGLTRRARDLLLAEIAARGARVVDVDDTVLGAGGLLAEGYLCDRPGDYHHGNAAWGAAVIDRFAAMAGLAPPAVLPAGFRRARARRLPYIFAARGDCVSDNTCLFNTLTPCPSLDTSVAAAAPA